MVALPQLFLIQSKEVTVEMAIRWVARRSWVFALSSKLEMPPLRSFCTLCGWLYGVLVVGGGWCPMFCRNTHTGALPVGLGRARSSPPQGPKRSRNHSCR